MPVGRSHSIDEKAPELPHCTTEIQVDTQANNIYHNYLRGIFSFLSLLANLIGVSRGEVHPAIKLNPVQFLLFVVIAASIAEELLFRGFLLNLLAPLKQRGIKILNRKISLSVMISALLFGLAHLSLASFGYSPYF